jgi:microcystin-dependent protein
MTTPYVGEIRMGGWNFAPVGWAQCNGALMSIAQNQTLFALIGTTYGGDGQSTFALPDLRGRLPVHIGPGFTLGQPGGSESVALTSNQVPGHSHTFTCSTSGGTQSAPSGYVPATLQGGTAYIQATPTAAMAPGSIQPGSGGNQPHDNMQPYLCVTFIISLYGVFPSQS